MAAYIDCRRQSGDVGRRLFYRKAERRCFSAEALRAYAESIYLPEQLALEPGIIRVWIFLAYRAQQRPFRKLRHAVERAADADADHYRRARIRPRSTYRVDDELLKALSAVRRAEHGKPTHILAAEALGHDRYPESVAGHEVQ